MLIHFSLPFHESTSSSPVCIFSSSSSSWSSFITILYHHHHLQLQDHHLSSSSSFLLFSSAGRSTLLSPLLLSSGWSRYSCYCHAVSSPQAMIEEGWAISSSSKATIPLQQHLLPSGCLSSLLLFNQAIGGASSSGSLLLLSRWSVCWGSYSETATREAGPIGSK